MESIKKRAALLILATLATAFVLTGCGKQIFETSEDKYKIKEYEASALVNDQFYIKNGTKFYMPYKASGKVSSASNVSDKSRVCWLGRDTTLVPDYYKGELIAYPSKDTSLDPVTVERFYVRETSFGIFNAEIDNDGYICFDAKNQTVSGSNAQKVFSGAKSSSIRIVSINGTPVSTGSIDNYGVFTGLTEDTAYEIDFYAGTYYTTATVTSDVCMLESFESYTINTANTTKNGYLALEMPEDAKSGYYYLSNAGLFRYYAFAKGEGNESDVVSNEAYYQSEEDKVAAYSQQYLVNIPEETIGIGVQISYDLTNSAYTDDDIIAKLSSPDGTLYNFSGANGVFACQLTKAMAGKWIVNVYPKDLNVTNVEVVSNIDAGIATEDTYSFTTTDAQEGMKFIVSYEGDSEDIWGYVKNESGETVTLELLKDNTLEAKYAYLPAGSYTMSVFHYVNTKVVSTDLVKDEDTTETETIIIIQ